METRTERKLDREILQLIKRTENAETLFPHLESLGYLNFFDNKLLIVHVIREGIPYSLFDNIQSYTPFSESDWAEYLSISTKSLQRYKKDMAKFKPIHSEKIFELAEVTNLGISVFEDTEKFKLWLNTPNYALGNNKPKDLLKDSYGKELVIGELTRIDYGILS
jgi:putative toxin-antitoxin system antitoxin component (TIGR02293 family)